MAGEMEDPVSGSVKTAANAAIGTTKTAMSPFQAAGRGEPGNIIVDPLRIGGETVYKVVENTGKTITLQKVDLEEM